MMIYDVFNLRFQRKGIDRKLKYSYPPPFVVVCRGIYQGHSINKGKILGKSESN